MWGGPLRVASQSKVKTDNKRVFSAFVTQPSSLVWLKLNLNLFALAAGLCVLELKSFTESDLNQMCPVSPKCSDHINFGDQKGPITTLYFTFFVISRWLEPAVVQDKWAFARFGQRKRRGGARCARGLDWLDIHTTTSFSVDPKANRVGAVGEHLTPCGEWIIHTFSADRTTV